MAIKKFFLDDVRSKFILVGILNTIAGFVIFTALYLLLKDKIFYVIILLISQILAIVFSHSTQRILVWKSQNEYVPELTKFASSYLVVSIANFSLLSVAVEVFSFAVLSSQYCISIILVFATYILQKKWIFSKSSR